MTTMYDAFQSLIRLCAHTRQTNRWTDDRNSSMFKVKIKAATLYKQHISIGQCVYNIATNKSHKRKKRKKEKRNKINQKLLRVTIEFDDSHSIFASIAYEFDMCDKFSVRDTFAYGKLPIKWLFL